MDREIDEAKAVSGELPETGNAELDAFLQTIDTASLDDPKWNDLFKKYLSKDIDSKQYFYLNVSKGFEKDQDGGYITYTGETGIGGEVGTRKSYYTINKGDLGITDNRDDASIFTDKDIDIIVQAIKANRDLKTFGVKFKKESVPESTRKDLDYARILFRLYFNRLCGDDKGIDSIKDGESTLYSLTRPRQHPLAGNDFLRIFSEAYKNANMRGRFRVTSRIVIIFNNLIADGEMSSQKLMKPNSFLSTLCFNPSLDRFTSSQVETIFELFGRARSLARDPARIDNQSISKWSKVDPQLPRYLILVANPDDDVFKRAVDNDAAIDDIDNLPEIGNTPADKPVLDWTIRDPEAIASMISHLYIDDSEDENKDIFLITNTAQRDGWRAKVVSESRDDFGFVITARKFAEDQIIKLVYTSPLDEDKGSRDGLKLKGILDISRVPEVEFLDDDTLKVNKPFEAGLEGVADKSRGNLKLISLAFRAMAGKDLQSPQPEKEADEEEDTSEPITREDTSFDASLYLEVIPQTGTDADDRRAAVKLKAGDRFVGLDGKVYIANEDGEYDIQKDSKIYITRR